MDAPNRPLTSLAPSQLQAWADALENLPDAVFMLAGNGTAGRILDLNSQATQMFGYERSEIVDRSIEMLVPEHARARHIQHRQAYAENPKLRRMGAGLALLGRRRDGTEFPIDVLLNPDERSATPGQGGSDRCPRPKPGQKECLCNLLSLLCLETFQITRQSSMLELDDQF